MLSKQINKIIDSYSYGSFVYTYYAYLDKFHCEPNGWLDFLEYLEYTRVENKVKDFISYLSNEIETSEVEKKTK